MQTDALASTGLPEGAIGAHHQDVQRLGVCVGSIGLLFPSDGGREVMLPPSVSRLPNTALWLRGLANVRGALVPVLDLAGALGVARESSTPSYLLIFGQGETVMGLLIDGLPRLISLDAATQLPELPEVPALLEGSVSAVYNHADRIWIDVESDLLFDSLARHVAL